MDSNDKDNDVGKNPVKGTGSEAARETPGQVDEAFRYQVQQLENIVREMGSKSEVGDDPGWIEEYVYRILEVSEALRGLARRRDDLNPSHKSYR